MVTLCEPHIVNLKKMLSEVKVVRAMSHDNILHFLGAVVGPDHYAVIGEYCSKGTLQVRPFINSSGSPNKFPNKIDNRGTVFRTCWRMRQLSWTGSFATPC